MKIIKCRTNHMENPIGFAMERAVISWVADSSLSKKQSTARIKAATDENMKNLIFDSGEEGSFESTATEIPIELKPRTRYYWTVQVRGDAGDEAVSGINWFETGKREEAWQGSWITTPWEDKECHPYFRRKFRIPSDFEKARLYVTGAGLFHLEINGEKAGNEYLAPGCNALDGWVQVQTVDVTEYLQTGENAIGVMMGNGWTKGPFGTFRGENQPYVSEFLLRAELRIEMKDGSEMVIATDSDWKCAPSPVLEDSIYDGERYDANKEILDWSGPECDDSAWDAAKEADVSGLGALEDRLSLPVVVKEIRRPGAVIHTPAGEVVLDMGQNMTGWLRFRVNEPKGTVVRISYGEVLQDGNFYRDNLRSAKAEYVYISDGEERTVEPHFTFYGFRYAKIEGLGRTVELEDFEGCVVYSDMEETGTLQTTDPWVNQLYSNAKWSQKGNFLDVPTDCPQRDERMGWTGDAQVFCRTASYNMETYAFFTKYLHDLWKEQQMCGGMVGNVVPSMLPQKQDTGSPSHGGAAAWGDAATIIPWNLYLHYGDREILKRQYRSMKDWVDWIQRQDEASGGKRLWTEGFQFGDWLALDGPVAGGTEGGTDKTLIASAYYKYSAELAAKAAEVLGEKEDAVRYRGLSEEIKSAIQDEFFTRSGRSAIPTQTAHVLALAFDLVEESAKQKTASELAGLLKKTKMHLTTGFVGTPLLCKALSEYGHSEAAYQLLLQEDYPGWLYEVKMGATTIWERWNSINPDGKISGTGMNSLNHYAYGSIAQWMYENMCGLRPLEPGFKKFRIAPETYGKIFGAEVRFESPKGRIEAGWKVTEYNHMKVRVKVPFDTAAVLRLPCSAEAEMELSAGEYEFLYPMEEVYQSGYSFDDSLDEMLHNPDTEQAVKPLESMISRMPADMAPDTSLSIRDMLGQLSPTVRNIISSKIDLDEMEEKLRQVRTSFRKTEFEI